MTTVLNTLLLIKSIHHYLILFANTAERLNMTEFKENDLLLWPHRDSYLLEILNGTYSVESAREDLQSLVDRENDADEEDPDEIDESGYSRNDEDWFFDDKDD